MSITAATGIPKFETGPQKSKVPEYNQQAVFEICHPLSFLFCIRFSIHCWRFYVLGGIESFSASRPFSRKHFIIGNHPEVRTGRADIVQNLVGTDLRVNSLDRSGHGERRKAEDMLERRGGENWGCLSDRFDRRAKVGVSATKSGVYRRRASRAPLLDRCGKKQFYMDGYWIQKKKKKTIMIPRVSLFVSSIIIFSPSSRGVMSTRRNAFAW